MIFCFNNFKVFTRDLHIVNIEFSTFLRYFVIFVTIYTKINCNSFNYVIGELCNSALCYNLCTCGSVHTAQLKQFEAMIMSQQLLLFCYFLHDAGDCLVWYT